MTVDNFIHRLLSRPRIALLPLVLIFLVPSATSAGEPADDLLGMRVCASKKGKKDCMVFGKTSVRYEQHRQGRLKSHIDLKVVYGPGQRYTLYFPRRRGTKTRMEAYEISGDSFKALQHKNGKPTASVTWSIISRGGKQ